MTTFFQEQREVLSATQALRRQLLNVLGDVDLGFRPADGCLSLAEVCREMGEIQHTYMESFRTFRHGHGAGHRVWLGRPHGYQLGKYSVYRCGISGHNRNGVLRNEVWEDSGEVRKAARRHAGAR